MERVRGVERVTGEDRVPEVENERGGESEMR